MRIYYFSCGDEIIAHAYFIRKGNSIYELTNCRTCPVPLLGFIGFSARNIYLKLTCSSFLTSFRSLAAFDDSIRGIRTHIIRCDTLFVKFRKPIFVTVVVQDTCLLSNIFC
jgi:hypothetical protein